MPGVSKVIVLDPDGRAGRQIQLGFQREGVPAEVAQVPGDGAPLELPADDTGLVVVGGSDGHALDLVRRARGLLDAGRIDAPIVFAGRGVRRTDAEAAGADEVVLQPAYLRDVITIGRLLRGQPASHRAHLVGNLVELTGVLTLVRALAALGRSAVLTLVRGLRRGEVRFYHGEVTSAQVGLIHGQAALHQLLLWTDARYDFHHEDVVRRQQIPLDRGELFADAERFLAGVRESSGRLSPAMVLEQDIARVQLLGKQIPTEVHGVLRMFDGHRVLADVLEDSPYRLFETLRVTQLALEVGLLRIATGPRQRATWRAVLAIEEWLVGGDDAPERPSVERIDSGPVARDPAKPKKKHRRKKRRANTPIAAPAVAATGKAEIDWGSLVPRVVGAEVGPLSGVVPAAHASGEIASRGPRERLEEVTAPAERERLFAPGEPSVVYDEARERAAIDAEQARQHAEEAAEEARRLAVIEKAAEAARRAEEARAEEVAEEARRLAVIEKAADAARRAEAQRTEPSMLVDPEPEPAPVAPAPEPVAVVEPEPEPAPPEPAPPEPAPAAPEETIDEPSDGVIRTAIATAETAPTARRPLPGAIPEDDRPDDATGELLIQTGPRPKLEPPIEEPSILVADLAAVHTAVAAVAAQEAAAPATPTIATPEREREVAAAQHDAADAFSEVEEDFFRTGHHALPAKQPDTFSDLDEGYEPVGFWDRLRGKKKPRR